MDSVGEDWRLNMSVGKGVAVELIKRERDPRRGA